MKTYVDLQRWSDFAKQCFNVNCICENCCNKNICDNIKPLHKNEYQIKPMKYAVLRLYAELGKPN